MKFNPKSEEEVKNLGLLEKGNYAFLVKNATEQVSKQGNQMIKLTLIVWGEDGREHKIFDYLMESMEFKLHHFCYSIGLGEMSEKGEFDCEKVIQKQGECKIYIKEDKTGEYLPKNSIADYIIPSDKKEKNFKDDELPF